MIKNIKNLAAVITVAITISAIIATPVSQAFAVAPSYTTLAPPPPTVTTQGNGNIVVFQLTAGGTIPHNPDAYISGVLVFGYAWGDGAGNLVVVTIHPGAGRDSTQNPNNWHPHTATANAAGCITSLVSPNGGISINKSALTLKLKASDATVTPASFAGAVPFTLVGDPACAVSGLKVSGIGDGVDNDGDTAIDEDPIDGVDNDGDTIVDEDP